jgi:hypothetical protein
MNKLCLPIVNEEILEFYILFTAPLRALERLERLGGQTCPNQAQRRYGY